MRSLGYLDSNSSDQLNTDREFTGEGIVSFGQALKEDEKHYI